MADASLGTAVLRTRLDTSGLKTGLAQAQGETQKFAANSTTAIKGIGTAFGLIVGSQGVRAYLTFMRSAAVEANQAATATTLFEKAIRRNNESVAEGASMVQRLSDRFGVAANIIEDSATTMLRQGANLEMVEKTLLTAGASAAAAGVDIAGAFQNVTTAVVSGNSVLLRSSGIIAGLGEAERSYARDIGKTVEQLTDQERMQARVNAIYHETRYEIEDLDRILQGLPRAQAEVTRQTSIFRQTAGDLALKVVTPLTQGFGETLRVVNALPTPVKNAGIAMTGAATGATALASGIVAIRAALRGLSGLGLLSFGPTGWIVLGVTAVAGLAAALSGRTDSLDKATQKASDALASGDTDSLTGALGEVIEQVDGPVKTAFQELRDDLVRTGDTGVEQTQRIANALALMQELRAAQEAVNRAQAEMDRANIADTALRGPGTFQGMAGVQVGAEPLLRTLQNSLNAPGTALFAAAIKFDEVSRRFVLDSGRLPEGVPIPPEVTRALDDATSQLTSAVETTGTAMSTAETNLAAANRTLEAVLARINAPAPGGDDGGGDTDLTPIQKRVEGLRVELTALQREVDHGLAEAATLAERQASTVDSAIRDLIRLGAGDNLITTLLGELGEFEAAVKERAVRIAPIIRAELMDERLRAERDEIDRLSQDASRSAQLAAQRRESEHLAAVARAPFIRAEEWDNSWFEERQQLEDMAIRAHNEARIAQQRRESEHLAAVARAPIIRAVEWDNAWFAEMEETQSLIDELAALRVMRENRRQAEIRNIMNAYNQGAPDGTLYGQHSAYLDADVARQADRMRSMDLTTTNTDRAVRAERELIMAREAAAATNNQLLADFARSEAERIAALRFGGENARTYTQQLQLQSDVMRLAAREGITLTEALERITDSGRSIADVQADITKAEEQWRTAGDDAGRAVAESLIGSLKRELERMTWRPTLQTIFGGATPEYEGKTERELKDAADRFANTVVQAGFAFGDATIKALQDGDIPGLIRAGLSGAGSILGGANLGSIGFLGGSIGIGSLIAGGLGLIGSLVGGLFGGGRDLPESRARGVSPRGAPAIDLSVIINQSLNIQSLTDPASRRAVDGLLDDMVRRVEDTLKRNVIPRLNALDGGAA